MNYAELKAQIRDLGFSDDDELEEFGAVVPNGINLAIAEINQMVGSVTGTYEITLDGSKSLTIIDMEDAEGFLEMSETPAVIQKETTDKDGNPVMNDTFEIFNDYDTREEGRMLFINSAGVRGKLRFYYKKQHTLFTEDTADDAPIELPRKYHMLVPLLSAYYIWLEDDQTKATYYYNRYETLMQSININNPRRIRILSGGL